MSDFNSNLTVEHLRSRVSYDPQTGHFTWSAICRGIRPGQKAGMLNRYGYTVIMIDKVNYHAHRLAWLYVNGVWPKNLIDHINGQKSDNRITNLREATKSENGQNQRKAKAGSKSGILGAHPHGKSGWRASIVVGGVTMNLGTYRTPEEAHQAYIDAKRKHHKMCTI